MMKHVHHMMTLSLLLLTKLYPNEIFTVDAIAIDAPTLTPQTISPRRSNERNRVAYPDNQFQIRKTKSSDIDAISSMLAMASTTSNDIKLNNWKHRIKYIGIKSSLEKQLHHRWSAIEEGTRIMSRFKNEYSTMYEQYGIEECLLDSELTCHLLWSNDMFRDKVKSAVTVSSERNAWEGHNFDYTPPNVALFNHVMITVVQKCNNREDVVGFCELAWLPRPRSHESCAPSIVNLITSPMHRRRGIASKLIDVASRYARTQWLNSDTRCSNGRNGDIGLYVHPENKSAFDLYLMKGFQVTAENEDGLLYMTRAS